MYWDQISVRISLLPWRKPYSTDYVADFGIESNNCNLDRSAHKSECVCIKACKMLGFVTRSAKDFRPSMSVLKHNALFARHSNMVCVARNPHTDNDWRRLERVQRKFFHFASYILKIPCPPYDYASVANKLGQSFLAERRHARVLRPLKGYWMTKLNVLHLSQ